MTYKNLFTGKEFGELTAHNRVVLAPMTRSKTTQPGDIPNAMMAEYYAQRASAGFIVSEATQISPQGKGYSFTPGIYNEKQVEGWKIVTQAVHEKGGKIFAQIWHVGRMSHTCFHGGDLPVAPSAIAPGATVWISNDQQGDEGGMVECPTPKALTEEDIKVILEDYAHAARNAIKAGFDGVEIHAANGYLLDQFMRKTSNRREDQYGGSVENRIRFPLKVVETVISAIGSKRVGIRLAPFIKQRGMHDDESVSTILTAIKKINAFNIAYVHLAEADWDDAPFVDEGFRIELRKIFDGAIVVAGNYTADKGEDLIAKGLVDFVAFGRKYISNPDLLERIKHNYPLAEITKEAPLFGGSAHGYTDYSLHSD